MAKKADIYQAKESFVTNVDGEQIAVTQGDLVRAGHPLLKGRDDLFTPAENYVRFDVEEATAAPGKKRGADEETPEPEPEPEPKAASKTGKK